MLPFMHDESSHDSPIIAFTDGAAKGNPGPGGWGAIVLTPDQYVTELGGGSPHTTNNKMELSGAIAALRQVYDTPGKVELYTDSTYVIQGITQWVHGWRRKGWKTASGGEVANRDLWEELAELHGARGKGGIHWHWVRGHQGTPGNERADEISVAFAVSASAAGNEAPRLYHGPLAKYPIPILDVPVETSVPARRSAGSGISAPAPRPGFGSGAAAAKSAKAYSYVSVVDGIPMRHTSWADCERRVKGRAGARFRKSTSAADEAGILRGWGIDPSQV